VVLDPFMGAGSTALAAAQTGRRYVGFDTEADYVALAERRLAEVQLPLEA
ncbi:MAG: site-specific DNA-methyltransferase, partial [Gemmatimonas sp.]|nr:site-specific DNA-methyltransferase [Gemmatimonas sp.]